MKILDKYIFKSVFFTAIFSVGLFVFVLVSGYAVKEVIGKLASGLFTVESFVKALVVLVPYVTSYALPMGLLTAILIVLGRLSAENEITAMKSVGISLFRLSRPVFLVAIMGVCFAVAINLYYAPIAKTSFREGFVNMIKENPLQFIKPKTFIKTFPGYVIYAGERDGSALEDFWIWELDDQKRVTMLIKAERGSLHYDSDNEVMILNLEKGTGEKRSNDDPENYSDQNVPTLVYDSLSLNLPMDQILGKKGVNRKLSMLTMAELLQKKKEWKIKEQEGVQDAYRERISVQTQIQKNFAMAFSVFALAMIAIPLAIRVRRSETFANLAIALVLGMTYYFLMVVVSWIDKKPALRPDILIWLPDIGFLLLGMFLFRKASKN